MSESMLSIIGNFKNVFLFVALLLARDSLVVYQFPTPGILLWLLLNQVSVNKWLLTLCVDQNQELLTSRDS